MLDAMLPDPELLFELVRRCAREETRCCGGGLVLKSCGTVGALTARRVLYPDMLPLLFRSTEMRSGFGLAGFLLTEECRLIVPESDLL